MGCEEPEGDRNEGILDINGVFYAPSFFVARYLSHGQEWSEKLRLRKRTRIIKYTLNPVWDEEFSLPVRRAGAVLKLEVWDWDRSSADDALGHLEISIGEELLSQKVWMEAVSWVGEEATLCDLAQEIVFLFFYFLNSFIQIRNLHVRRKFYPNDRFMF